MRYDCSELVSEGAEGVMLRFFHSRVNPGKRAYFPHQHTAFEISVIRSGEGVYQLQERTYTFAPGDVFLFGTNEIHYITEITGEAPLDLVNLQFEPRFVWMPGGDLFDYRYLDIFFRRNGRFRHQLSHDDPRADVIRTLLRDIDEEFSLRRESYDLMVKNKLLTLLVYIRRNYAEYFDVSPAARDVQHIRRLDAAMKYIDAHLAEALTLAELSEQAHMSRSRFSALFRELNGLTPWEYIVGRRVSRAARLLSTSDETILEIAVACGFNNTANFNHAFRKVIGASPSEYRKRHAAAK